MMELNIETPESIKDRKVLVFDPHFHNVGQLLQGIQPNILLFDRLNKIATTIQKNHCFGDTEELRHEPLGRNPKPKPIRSTH
jgi:hypothetical protein